MDTLPLPPRPDIEQYRKRAKSLVAAANSGDPDAVRTWASEWLTALAKLLDADITPYVQGSFDRAVEHLRQSVESRLKGAASGRLSLADAQHLIAEAHSYETWAAFASEIESLRSRAGSSNFERAADAVVNGDLEALDELLARNPGLVHERSARKHRATLLHYVAANGVEDFRQKTPPNAVHIAERLLAAGAEVDATAETYGGGTYNTTMNLLVSSMHPAEAGLQSKLVEVLLDHGAAIDGVANDSSPILTALSFGYHDAAETLARRGAAMSHVVIAAGVGRLDLVREWVIDATTLTRTHPPYRGPRWVHLPDDATGQIEMALLAACKFGRSDVAAYLLDLGVNPNAKDGDAMTALHWASASGLLDVMNVLIAKGAQLESRNTWGGTVVDSTVWFASNATVRGIDYTTVVRRLLEAGADAAEIYPFPTGVETLDQIIGGYRHQA